MQEEIKIKISECKNMETGKVIILCNPDTRLAVEGILSIAQDKLEEGENIG